MKLFFVKIEAPETPSNLRSLSTITSNTVDLEWTAPKYTGEPLHYILSVNNQHNLSISRPNDSPMNPMKLFLERLEPDTVHEFKILAYNSIGSSPFSRVLSVKTLPAYLNESNLPGVKVAAFDDTQESICFEIQNKLLNFTSGLVAKMNIIPSAEYLLFHGQFKKATSNPMLFEIDERKRHEKICISFTQILNIQENQPMARTIHLNNSMDQRHDMFPIRRMLTQVSVTGRTYREFKSLNKINISICFALLNSVCSQQITVSDNSSLLSFYLSSAIVLAFFLLLVLIFILLKRCMSSLKSLSKLRQVDTTLKRNPVYMG